MGKIPTIARANDLRRLAILALALALVPMAAPVTSASEAEYPPQTDAVGDPIPSFGLTPPLPVAAPSTPVTAPYDLVEFGILDEDELGFRIYVEVANLKGDPTTMPFFGQAFYDVVARLEGTQIFYSLEWMYEVPLVTESPTGVHEHEAMLCLREVEEEGYPWNFSTCVEQQVTFTVDYDANRFEAYIMKDALMGRASVWGDEPPIMAPLTKGSRLGEIFVQVSRNFPLFLYDRLPDGDAFAATYVFQSEAANSRIRLALANEDALLNEADIEGDEFPTRQEESLSNRVSVAPGVPSLVRLRVENLNSAKRIINLSTEIIEGDANRWSAQITPTLHLPSGESRFVNLIVNVSGDVQHREEAVAIVRGQSLAFAGEIGALRLELVASVPPGPERKTLFFHAGDPESDALSDTLCQALPCIQDRAWLNTLEEDALATSDAGTRMGIYGFGPSGGGGFILHRLDFMLDTPLSTSLVLDPTVPIDVQLSFQPASSFEGEVGLEISTLESNRVVASGSTTATVAGGTPVAFTIVPLQESLRIEPQDGGLVASVSIQPSVAGAGAATLLPTFEFVPGESQMTLPFVPDPDAGRTNLSAGPAFISLAAQSSPEDFVNPGRAKLFNATVVNEGIQADEARLEVVYDDADWKVELFPGARYRLPPGDSAEFAILVHAPEDAKEGDQLHVLVNASSLSDPGALSQLRLTAIVTTTIELADESHYYASDVDSSEKVVRAPASDTPGFELPLVALGFLAVALIRRFRRDA